MKARRKRTYRIGGRGNEPRSDDKARDTEPALVPPELDISEMDRYFSPGEFDDVRQTATPQMELPSNRRPPPMHYFSLPHGASNNRSNSGVLRNRHWANPGGE